MHVTTYEMPQTNADELIVRVDRHYPLPPVQPACVAGPGLRCQCAECKAMRRQLWAVQPEDRQ